MTSEPKDIGSTGDAVPTTGDTHRNVLVEVVRNWIVASHTYTQTCFTQFTSVEILRARRNQTISESTTSNEKRAQPLSEWSDVAR